MINEFENWFQAQVQEIEDSGYEIEIKKAISNFEGECIIVDFDSKDTMARITLCNVNECSLQIIEVSIAKLTRYYANFPPSPFFCCMAIEQSLRNSFRCKYRCFFVDYCVSGKNFHRQSLKNFILAIVADRLCCHRSAFIFFLRTTGHIFSRAFGKAIADCTAFFFCQLTKIG